DSVFVVVSGRFEVWVQGLPRAVNEIGVGEPIGETGFFSGMLRTATIVAARDSVVLELDRPSFDNIARQVPAIYQTLLGALARRMADNSGRAASRQHVGVARTVAAIAGARQPDPAAFYRRPATAPGSGGQRLLLDHSHVQRRFPGLSPDDPTVSNWLNAIENEYDLIVYLTDDTLTDWTRKAVRQADQVLIAVFGEAPDGINPTEA